MAKTLNAPQCLRTFPTAVRRLTFKIERIVLCKAWLSEHFAAQVQLSWPIADGVPLGEWQELDGIFYFSDPAKAAMFSLKFPAS
jgi:hypothetical protein